MTEPRSQHKRRPAVIRYIPRNAAKVAIVGRGHDPVDDAFKSLNPTSSIRKWKNIAHFEEGHSNSDGFTASFDCIVLLNFEFDTKIPQGLLEKARLGLRDNGVLVVEFANPFFFERMETDGEFSQGLGSEHLNSLAKAVSGFSKSVSRSFKNGGLIVDQILRSGGGSGTFEEWQSKWDLQKAEDIKHWGNLKPVLQSASLVYRATKRPVRKIKFQSQILKPVGGVNNVRIHEPLSALVSLPGVSATASRAEKLKPADDGGNRLFLWHRPVLTFEDSLKHIQSLRKAGYLIITEFDDHYSPWPKIEENNFLSFAGVHAVQTTTPKLADMLREFNPEVAVFPNQLDYFPSRELKKEGDPVRIFFGALNRKQDWTPIINKLNKVLKQTDVPFVFDVVFDKSFFEALETGSKTFTPHCTYEIYKSKLAKADISLMPLMETGFNEMKSDLKLVEAAGHGAVPIASEVVYGEESRHHDFSMICRQPEDYAVALQWLLEHPGKRVEMQDAGRDYVRNSRLLCHHLKGRYQWYQRLIENKDSLDAALEKRLAAIQP